MKRPQLTRHLFRRAGAILGPAMFSIAGGHLLSAITSRSVDAFGKPIPWYTYPAIDFLRELDLAQCKVAEFGSGHSTLWWAERAGQVLALESNPEWFEAISQKTEAMPHVDVRRVATPAEAKSHLQPDFYDIIVVDDGSGVGPKGRPLNVETAFAMVKRTGIVIVDNADTSYGTGGHYPIIESGNEAGWLRVDFVGHAPGSTKRSCTSLFFRPEVSLLSGLKPPRFGQFRRAA
jgi:hypothetical protein